MLLNENTLAEHLSVDFGYNIMRGTFSTIPVSDIPKGELPATSVVCS